MSKLMPIVVASIFTAAFLIGSFVVIVKHGIDILSLLSLAVCGLIGTGLYAAVKGPPPDEPEQ